MTDGRVAPAEGGGAARRRAGAGDRPAWVVIRTALLVVILLDVYYEAPLDRPLDLPTGALFFAGLAALALVFVYEIRGILTSPRPRWRAIRALATTVPVLLIVFAAAYSTIAAQDPAAFTQSLTRTDGLYFTLTTFATVGYGDIAPKSELARIVVMIQMLIGLVTVGVVAKVVLGAVQVAEQRHHTAADAEVTPPAPDRVRP